MLNKLRGIRSVWRREILRSILIGLEFVQFVERMIDWYVDIPYQMRRQAFAVFNRKYYPAHWIGHNP